MRAPYAHCDTGSYNDRMKRTDTNLCAASIVSIVLTTAGCTPLLRAVPGPSQGPIENERGVFEYRNDLVVSAVGISRPPIGTENEFVAFGIQVQNNSKSSLAIDVSRIQLGQGVGPQWVEELPVPPDDLLRAFQSARVSAWGFAELTPPEPVRWEGRHGTSVYRYYGRRGYPYCGDPGWGYYSYHYYYYDSARDIYLQRQAAAGFLARLLRSQAIPPGHVVGGFVVFAKVLRKGDEFRLLVPVYPAVASAPTPATAPTASAPTGGADVFEFHFVAR